MSVVPAVWEDDTRGLLKPRVLGQDPISLKYLFPIILLLSNLSEALYILLKYPMSGDYAVIVGFIGEACFLLLYPLLPSSRHLLIRFDGTSKTSWTPWQAECLWLLATLLSLYLSVFIAILSYQVQLFYSQIDLCRFLCFSFIMPHNVIKQALQFSFLWICEKIWTIHCAVIHCSPKNQQSKATINHKHNPTWLFVVGELSACQAEPSFLEILFSNTGSSLSSFIHLTANITDIK